MGNTFISNNRQKYQLSWEEQTLSWKIVIWKTGNMLSKAKPEWKQKGCLWKKCFTLDQQGIYDTLPSNKSLIWLMNADYARPYVALYHVSFKNLIFIYSIPLNLFKTYQFFPFNFYKRKNHPPNLFDFKF